MKISVKYGLYTSAAVVGWMLLGIALKLTKENAAYGGYLGLIIYAIGIFFSVKHTRDREINQAPDPRLLLRAGLITAAIVSLTYCIYTYISFEILSTTTAPVGAKVMSMLMLFIMNLLVGGLLAVMLSFFYARKRD